MPFPPGELVSPCDQQTNNCGSALLKSCDLPIGCEVVDEETGEFECSAHPFLIPEYPANMRFDIVHDATAEEFGCLEPNPHPVVAPPGGGADQELRSTAPDTAIGSGSPAPSPIIAPPGQTIAPLPVSAETSWGSRLRIHSPNLPWNTWIGMSNWRIVGSDVESSIGDLHLQSEGEDYGGRLEGHAPVGCFRASGIGSSWIDGTFVTNKARTVPCGQGIVERLPKWTTAPAALFEESPYDYGGRVVFYGKNACDNRTTFIGDELWMRKHPYMVDLFGFEMAYCPEILVSLDLPCFGPSTDWPRQPAAAWGGGAPDPECPAWTGPNQGECWCNFSPPGNNRVSDQPPDVADQEVESVARWYHDDGGQQGPLNRDDWRLGCWNIPGEEIHDCPDCVKKRLIGEVVNYALWFSQATKRISLGSDRGFGINLFGEGTQWGNGADLCPYGCGSFGWSRELMQGSHCQREDGDSCGDDPTDLEWQALCRPIGIECEPGTFCAPTFYCQWRGRPIMTRGKVCIRQYALSGNHPINPGQARLKKFAHPCTREHQTEVNPFPGYNPGQETSAINGPDNLFPGNDDVCCDSIPPDTTIFRQAECSPAYEDPQWPCPPDDDQCLGVRSPSSQVLTWWDVEFVWTVPVRFYHPDNPFCCDSSHGEEDIDVEVRAEFHGIVPMAEQLEKWLGYKFNYPGHRPQTGLDGCEVEATYSSPPGTAMSPFVNQGRYSDCPSDEPPKRCPSYVIDDTGRDRVFCPPYLLWSWSLGNKKQFGNWCIAAEAVRQDGHCVDGPFSAGPFDNPNDPFPRSGRYECSRVECRRGCSTTEYVDPNCIVTENPLASDGPDQKLEPLNPCDVASDPRGTPWGCSLCE